MLMTQKNIPQVSDFPFRRDLQDLPLNAGADMIRYGRTKADILSLAQGEGCGSTPDFITIAAQDAIAAGKTFYGPVLGFPEVREGISQYYKGIYKFDVSPERIFMTGSGTTAMHLALSAVLNAGDEVIAVTPIWKNLLSAAEVAGATVKQFPLTQDASSGAWSLDLEKLFDAVTPNTRAILVVTPSNPTGWVMKDLQIKAMMEFARARNIWLIADEVYGRITYDTLHAPSFLAHANDTDKLFVVNSFSKAYAMTGWRLGWLVGPRYAESVIRDLALYNNMGPASFIQFAGLAALQNGEAFIQSQIKAWRDNRALLNDFFASHSDFEYKPSDATFYAFFRHSKKADSVSYARQLIDQVSLSLAPGAAFGQCAEGFMRLSYACSKTKLHRALEKLASLK